MKKSLTALLLLTLFITACSDDEPFSWSSGNPASGTAVASDPLYTITDYTLPQGNSSIALSNLNEGDRVVLIPLYAVEGSGEAQLRTAFRLRAEYSGGTVPDTRSLYNPLPPIRSIETLKRDSLPAGDPAVPITRSVTRTPSRSYTVGETVTFRLLVDFDNSGAGWTDAPAKVMYKGTRCYVYFTSGLAAHSNAGNVATNIGLAFDNYIHPRVTALYGHELGGEPGGDGGVDGDPLVTILYEDVTANPPGGYFSSRNQRLTADDINSNQREMFVICHNTSYMDVGYPRNSTVAHEYQHLIEYNRVYEASGRTSYPMSFFNEGLSQVAEGVAGYGPDSRMSYVQDDPRLSYASWGMNGKDIGYAYGAAFATVSYMVRRFGPAFISNLLEAPISGTVANVDTLLKNRGYADGYPGIVLDMLTAQYLNDGVYSYPATNLYPGDVGINTTGTTPTWYGYKGPTTNQTLLAGPRTKFYNSYPTEITGSLYDYGADMYEFVSGQGGTLSFLFNETLSGVRLRVIRYRLGSNIQPRIDGYADDWIGRSVVSVSDPAGDNQNGSNGGADFTNMSGFITNDVLYLAIRVNDPARLTDSDNIFLLALDVDTDPSWEYHVYLWDSRVRIDDASTRQELQLNAGSTIYVRKNILEVQLPLTIFPDLTGTSIRVYPWSYLPSGSTADTMSNNPLVLTR